MNYLVVSNPPHSQSLNAMQAGEILGLAVAEVTMQTRFAAPEIWVACKSEVEAEQKSSALRECGLNTIVVALQSLQSLPAFQTVTQFDFLDVGLCWRGLNCEFTLPYHAPLVILAIDFKQIGDEYQKHKAKEQGRKRRKQTMFKAGEAQKLGLLGALAAGEQVSAVAEEREVMLAGGATGASVSEGACFELYSEYRGETTRLSVPFVRLNYSGLGDKKRGSTRENLDTLQMLLLERFEQAKYDNRLVGVTYRPPVRAGVSLDILLQPAKLPGGVDKRAELGSRLTYMACRHNA